MDKAIEALIERKKSALEKINSLAGRLVIDRQVVADLERQHMEAIALVDDIDEAIKLLSPAGVGGAE